MRIVSLLPSATEIVAELGLADSLVGRSHECDSPASVRSLPVVSLSRLDPAGLSGAQIDAAVRDAVSDGTSLYAVDADVLAALRPDLVITQDLCRVCAVSSGEVCDVGAHVVSLDPRSLADIASSVEQLADVLGVPDRGRQVAAAMLERIDLVRVRTAATEPRRVFVAEWHDPPFASGHWIPEMVEAAGGREVLGRAREPSRPVTWDDVAAGEPEVVIVAPCGYDEPGARRAWQEVAGTVPARLAAIAVPVDANAYFSRPSPRVAVGVELLERIITGLRVADAPSGRARADHMAGAARSRAS